MAEENIPSDDALSPGKSPNPTQKTSSDISIVSSVTNPISCVEIVSNDTYVEHPCFEILKGGRRGHLKNMHYRIELVTNILDSPPSTYLQQSYCSNPTVTLWYKKYSPYKKHPKKWNRSVMAAAICEFDILMENASKLAEAKESVEKLPPPLVEFFP